MDKVPQRVLVHELKRAIDMIPRDRQAGTRVINLVRENPRSARSTHVLRNLGRDRVAVLGDLLGKPLARNARASGLPSPTDASDSSSRKETASC